MCGYGFSNELLKNVEPTIAASSSKLKIVFDYIPNELTVNLWSVKGEKEVTLETDNTVVLPTEKGTYIYDVSARWKEGSSSFFFSIVK